MIAGAPLVFTPVAIAEARQRIPDGDFIGPQYDIRQETAVTDILLLLSTPRSGSTLLCELLRLNDVCLPHEYFQPAQYMPLLAERWSCLDGERLDEAAYVRALVRARTFPNGWLGINLHGSHLRHFIRMERHLPAARLHYVHLIRRDVIAQAVSYHIASQTRQWSSEFAVNRVPEYSQTHIQRRLERIQEQNALIQAFQVARRATGVTIIYEDLVVMMEDTLRRVPGVPGDRSLKARPSLQRQADTRSAEWITRFAEEKLAAALAPAAPASSRVSPRGQGLMSRITRRCSGR